MNQLPLEQIYQKLERTVPQVRQELGRPLTFAEKILFSHLDRSTEGQVVRGKSEVKLRPDRVAMQDATAQMALLQFMSSKRERVAVPTSIHCDHLIRAEEGARKDTLRALDENAEVYDFLASAASRSGIDFWKPGSGIIHQVILENYACPGTMMIGTDSHTPNAGGIGMIAIGVGGADAADVMSGLPWGVTWPKLIGVHLTGELRGWTSPKDVILKVAGILTVQGGTGKIVEYFGSGVRSISCTGRATIANMGAELGATTSIFPFDENSLAYLRATGRDSAAALCERCIGQFQADVETQQTPERYFDEVISIDLSQLEPHVVGPHTPDLARPISDLAAEVREKRYPEDIRVALIGSCTNSSYEDIGRAAHIAAQAQAHGVRAKIPFMITPGSEAVYATIERDGFLEKLSSIGGLVLANACGPCIGQWKRSDIREGETNTIVTSFNRNFPRRNDGNASTLAFIASPEIVTAFALSGSLSFNPLTDELEGEGGARFRLSPPQASALPADGLARKITGYVPPAQDPASVKVIIDPHSERLALLEPFPAWDGRDHTDLAVLLKAKGKCTTDHISPAGPWLRYRGHLDRISDNVFTGATNAFAPEPGMGFCILDGKLQSLPAIARAYQAAGRRWVAIGDENYGEGSSREHAAMSPRYLGGVAVIAKSFARIHETNLKKQGMLALTFTDPSAYDRIAATDSLSLLGLVEFRPGGRVRLLVKHEDGSTFETDLSHSFTEEQVGWFRAGSALNSVR